MKFKGTVIITDPCYFVKKDKDWTADLWTKGDLTSIGFNNSLCSNTIYGDWSCVTMKTDDTNIKDTLQELFEEYNWKGLSDKVKEDTPIGKFCADAGMVSVILLEDLEKYNPEVIPRLKSHLATIIENYDGEIEICTFNDKYVTIIGDNFYTIQE